MERNNIFINMHAWDIGATREISRVGDGSVYDIHNNCIITDIVFTPDTCILTFKFSGQAYDSVRKLSSVIDRFDLKFEEVEILGIIPEDFIPFTGSHITDDFLFAPDKDSDRARFRWTGDTDSERPDPQIEFTARRVSLTQVQ